MPKEPYGHYNGLQVTRVSLGQRECSSVYPFLYGCYVTLSSLECVLRARNRTWQLAALDYDFSRA